jgi:CRP-like cAMP-binding protein
MPRPKYAPIGNYLLAALPLKVYGRLLPDMEVVALRLELVLHKSGEPIKYVYFPTTAVLSMLCTMKSGDMVETGMVGNEGVAGLATCLDSDTSSPYTIVQVAGEAVRISARSIRKEFDRGGALHSLLLRYLNVLFLQVSQSVGCNTHHLLEARLSRWLLIVRDRVASDVLLLQHEFLSHMLGTHRSGVTMAAGALRTAGLIRYARGKITILDHEGLEASACECYEVIRMAFEHARLR